MKFLGSLFLISLLTIGILAQEQGATIIGQLVFNGNPVSNTEVKLVSVNRYSQENIYTTTTDGEGNYTFQNVADGSYQISFADSQNKQILQRVYYISKGRDITAEVVSGEFDPNLLGKVTVAAGTSQPIAEVSKTVNVIDAQEIKERNEFSLTDALRTIPGFRVQQLGGFGKTANIKTRGLRNQDTAILIDGVRFRDASSITGDASAFLSDFVFSDTGRVEVLRGSGSSLYGTNAIGGVLDLRTREPRNGFHGSFLGEGGNLGLKRVLGNVSDGTDKFGFTLGVSRTVYSEGIDREDDAHNTNANGRIEYKPGANTSISGRFYISDAFVRLNSNPDTIGALPPSNRTIINAVPLSIAQLNNYANGQTITNAGSANFIPDANDPDSFQKSKFFNGQIVLTQILSSKLTFQGYYSGLKSSRKNENDILGVGFQSASTSFFDGTINTLNGHFNWSPTTNNLVTIGYEFEHEKYGNDGATPGGAGDFFTRAKQTSNTFYAQDLLGFFNDRLQIAGGFRAQFFNLKTPEFSAANAPYTDLTLENPPNAYTFDGSVSYFFDKTGTKIRAHVGNGYRVPSLYERFGTFYATYLTPNQFIALGAPDLKPERSIAYDGGIDQTLFNNRARLSATYFYTKLIDTIGFGTLPQPDRFGRDNFASGGGYLNTKGGVSRGAELSGELRATSSTRIFASYTFTNSDQRAPQVAGSGILKTLGIPAHQFSLVATQRIKNLTLNFDFLATSNYLAPIFSNKTFSTYVYRFDGNRKADLTGSYEIPLRSENVRLRIFATVGNLFDYEYYENGFRTEGRTARGGLGISF